ncbi:MAG: (2Fe-2S) ferredoxin domain-containing protein [Deltaproteobacteria bacterium]|nr:MAG: (2Fe-2S) ferredoxin domain-containing protein [Deltaproteobacteria bacterium]
MAKLKLEDLEKIREKVRGTTILREGGSRAKVTVHMGTCGIASGARNIMSTLLDEIEKREIKDVIVTTSGCAGLCSREPMATVELQDQPPIKYVDLTEEKILKIFDEHVLGGKVVQEHVLGVGSETTY